MQVFITLEFPENHPIRFPYEDACIMQNVADGILDDNDDDAACLADSIYIEALMGLMTTKLPEGARKDIYAADLHEGSNIDYERFPLAYVMYRIDGLSEDDAMLFKLRDNAEFSVDYKAGFITPSGAMLTLPPALPEGKR